METTIRAIVLHPKTNKVLMCYYKRWNTYMCPGGHKDSESESDYETLKREMYEECGSTKIKVVKHLINLLINKYIDKENSLHKYYLTKIDKISLENRSLEPEEVIDGLTLMWVTPEEVIKTNTQAYYDSIMLDNLKSLPLIKREIVLFNYLLDNNILPRGKKFKDNKGIFTFPNLDKAIKFYWSDRDVKVEKVPIYKLVQDNNLLDDEDLESYHQRQWNNKSAKEFRIDSNKINQMRISEVPYAVKHKDGTYELGDGRHRIRALYNEGYSYVELPVIYEGGN